MSGGFSGPSPLKMSSQPDVAVLSGRRKPSFNDCIKNWVGSVAQWLFSIMWIWVCWGIGKAKNHIDTLC